jgi:hypothetical protein
VLIHGDTARQARELYAARFPRYRDFLRRAPGEDPTASTFGALQLYRLLPERLQILDEGEFGDGVFITATIFR